MCVHMILLETALQYKHLNTPIKWKLKTTLERLRPGQVYSHLLQVVEILCETASPHRFHSGLHMRVVFWEEAGRADKLSTVKSALKLFHEPM